MTSAWRKFSRAPRGYRLLLLSPPRLRRAQATISADLFWWPARRPRTTTTTIVSVGAVWQEEEEQLPWQLWPQQGRWRLWQRQLQGSGCQRTLALLLQPLEWFYPYMAGSRGSRAACAKTTSCHDGDRTILWLLASAGQACLCATPGATSCPPWAHVVAGPAAARTDVEPVDWVLGPAVPRQLIRHHDAKLARHHGLGHRLWRLQPYHA
jgi:hypothetical protein